MSQTAKRSRLPLPQRGDDSIKDARSWWAGIVTNPRFATILNQAKVNAVQYSGVQDTSHGQLHAGGHNAGIAALAEAIENLAYPDSE